MVQQLHRIHPNSFRYDLATDVHVSGNEITIFQLGPGIYACTIMPLKEFPNYRKRSPPEIRAMIRNQIVLESDPYLSGVAA